MTRLRTIHVVGLRFNAYAWNSLQSGLAYTNVLSTLRFNMVNVDRHAIVCLADALKVNSSVRILDLSYNDIKDADGDMLAKIVSN